MTGIDVNNSLRGLDMNLLLTLDALLAEHNVTRAAERLHLSQPTVSLQLARLRAHFNDPLLIPLARGMLPSARADQLREPLRNALQALQIAIQAEPEFNPASARHIWRIAATDYTESTVFLPLLPVVRQAAPNIQLAVLEMKPGRINSQLSHGEIDLAFHVNVDIHEELHRCALFTEQYVLTGRRGHPALKRKPSLKKFCELEQVIVSPDGGGFFGDTDKALQALGMSRKVVCSVPHFLFLEKILMHSDLLAMLPVRLAKNNPALQTVPAPLEVASFDILMLWHERLHRDPAHRWLRQQVISCVG